jgi:hypothetical protein
LIFMCNKCRLWYICWQMLLIVINVLYTVKIKYCYNIIFCSLIDTWLLDLFKRSVMEKNCFYDRDIQIFFNIFVFFQFLVSCVVQAFWRSSLLYSERRMFHLTKWSWQRGYDFASYLIHLKDLFIYCFAN